MANADVLLFNISAFIAGLFLLEYGADKFVDHTAIVAKRLGVSPTLIGLLTCGAEWEEVGAVTQGPTMTPLIMPARCRRCRTGPETVKSRPREHHRFINRQYPLLVLSRPAIHGQGRV